jgi:hypothetical protein
MINLLEPEICLNIIYNLVFSSEKKYCISVTKIKTSALFREITAVYSRYHTKPSYSYGKIYLANVKAVLPIVLVVA